MSQGRATKEVAEWEAKIAQKEAQINDITEELAQKYGYEAKTLGGRKRPARRRADSLAAVGSHGGGLMAELGSHQLDASSIFITAQEQGARASRASAGGHGVGGRSIFPLDRDCDDHVYCIFEFPGKGYYKDDDTHEVADPNKKIVVTYSSINGNGFGGYGEIVFGTKGTLILEQEQEAMLFKGSSTTTADRSAKTRAARPAMDTYETGGGAAVAQAAGGSGGPVSRGYNEEIEHWAWCIRNPAPEHQPHCTPVVALGDAVIALTANLAIKKQERIEFKPEWFDPASSETPEGSAPREAAQVT